MGSPAASADAARGLDAAFLFAEERATPMHVGGLMVLEPAADGPLRVAALRRLVRSRLALFPRFDQVPSVSPLRGVRWVASPPVLRAHIRSLTLPPGSGSWRDLLRVAAAFHASPLPRSRPLWEMLLVSGLPGGRQGLLLKTHHSITDGLAGIRVMSVLTSGSGAEAVAPGVPPRSAGLAAAGLGAAWFLAGGPIALPGPFNGRVGPARALATARVPLALAVAAKRRLGVRVDDVFLAAVSLGVRRHLLGRRSPLPRSLRTMVPVSLRTGGGDGIGNRVSALFVDLPVAQAAPADCASAIASSKAVLRRTHEVVALDALFQLAGSVPLPVAALGSRLIAALPVCNLIVSDIPGPSSPIHLLGHRVSAAYPFMPLMREVGLSIAGVTLDGFINLCVTADPRLVPRPASLCSSVAAAFEELARCGEPVSWAPRNERSEGAPGAAVVGRAVAGHRRPGADRGGARGVRRGRQQARAGAVATDR